MSRPARPRAPLDPGDGMTPKEEAEVVEKHKPFVWKHARRWPHLEQEDATQTAYLAFVTACRTWKRSGGANIRTYSNSGVFWRLRRAHKLEQRQRAPESLDAELPNRSLGDRPISLHDLLSKPATQEEDLEAKERGAILREALADLDPREHRIIRMRFFEEKTLDEIGKVLGCSRERVRQIEVGCLRKLRSRLEGAL